MPFPVLDANVHATPDGQWFDTGLSAGLSDLLAALDKADVDRACLTGLPGACSTREVCELADSSGGRLIPVGCLDPGALRSSSAAVEEVRSLRAEEVVGFKVHPRLSGIDALDERLIAVLGEIDSWAEPMPVWLCTFLHRVGRPSSASPVEALSTVVGSFPRVPFVLVHSGGPDLLRLATALRGVPNAWFDLSYVLTHFMGSSVETDLRYLLRVFDERLVFGSDFPEGDIALAVSNLASMVEEENPPAAARVFGGNLATAMGL